MNRNKDISRIGIHATVNAHNLLGEGPIWDAKRNTLLWVDILNDSVFCLDPVSGDVRSVDAPAYPSAIACTTGSDYLLAGKGVLGLFSFDNAHFSPLAMIEPNIPGNRCNDGKCDPDGNFWIGTMDLNEKENAGSVYRLGADGQPQRIISGLTISNGMAWDTNTNRFYHVDSAARSIRVYHLHNGDIGELTDTMVIDAPGWPDGMTIDEEGMLWVAMWDGWSVLRMDPTDHQVLHRIKLPVARPTSCVFGGEDLSTLYITSACIGIGDTESQPLAGSLFAINDIGIKGTQSHEFRIS